MTTYSIEIATTEILGTTELLFIEWEVTEYGKQSVKTVRHNANDSFALIKLVNMYKKDFGIVEVSYKIVTSAGNTITDGTF